MQSRGTWFLEEHGSSNVDFTRSSAHTLELAWVTDPRRRPGVTSHPAAQKPERMGAA